MEYDLPAGHADDDGSVGEADAATGDVEIAADDIDTALDAIEQELADVELALERLGDGTFGHCETCGGVLSPRGARVRTQRAGSAGPTSRSRSRRGSRRVRYPFLVSQKILSMAPIWPSRSSATLASLVFLTSPAALVAFQKRSCELGVLLRCSGLK